MSYYRWFILVGDRSFLAVSKPKMGHGVGTLLMWIKPKDAFHKIAKDRKVIPDPIDDRKFQE